MGDQKNSKTIFWANPDSLFNLGSICCRRWSLRVKFCSLGLKYFTEMPKDRSVCVSEHAAVAAGGGGEGEKVCRVPKSAVSHVQHHIESIGGDEQAQGQYSEVGNHRRGI